MDCRGSHRCWTSQKSLSSTQASMEHWWYWFLQLYCVTECGLGKKEVTPAVSVSVKTAMSFNRHSARAFIECNPTPWKFCWRMLELTRLCAVRWSKPCTLALLSRRGAEHLLLLAHVQCRIILWVYTRLSICSWKWIIYSLVFIKVCLLPQCESLGFSVWWNVLALVYAQQTAPSRWSKGHGIRKFSNYCKKNIPPFLFCFSCFRHHHPTLRSVCARGGRWGQRTAMLWLASASPVTCPSSACQFWWAQGSFQ